MKVFVMLETELYTLEGIKEAKGEFPEKVEYADKHCVEWRNMLFDPDYITSLALNIEKSGTTKMNLSTGLCYTIKGEPDKVFFSIKDQIKFGIWSLEKSVNQPYGLGGENFK